MPIYDLVIIGGGPAALAAAAYAQTKRLHVALIYEQLGGKTAGNLHAAQQEQPGSALIELLARQVKEQQIDTIHDHVATLSKHAEIFHVATRQHQPLSSRAVLVATGAAPKRLNLPGIQYLLSVGYSLTTFAHTLAQQRVAVVGVTPRTVRGIAEILDSAEHIYLITEAATLPDLPFLDALRQAPQLEIMTETVVRDVIGFSAVKSILVKHAATIKSLPIDRIFVDLGLNPNTQFLRELAVTDSDGFVIVDEGNATRVEGLFAAGDVTTSQFGEQALIAVGDGVRAATSAYDFILITRLAALCSGPPSL